MIGPRTSVAARSHYVTLQNPSGAPTADSEGNPVQAYADLNPPAMYARITPATAADLERLTHGTVIATASHVITFPHHPQVNTQTRITFGTRLFYVQGVSNPEERNVETICLANEVVT